jgi:hypothetical protein
VKYVEDAEVEELFRQYTELKNFELKGSSAKKLTEQNKMLQKKATIQTTAYTAEIGYISGRYEEVTIIAREVETESPLSNLMLVEFVPKEIVASSSDIVFVTPGSIVLKQDPVFEYSLSKATEIVYYIKNTVALESIPKIKPVLFTTVQGDSSNTGVTGFSIFESLGLSGSNKTIFFAEILVIFILIGVYFYYSSGSSKQDIKPLTNDYSQTAEEGSEDASAGEQDASQINQSYETATVNPDGDKMAYLRTVIQKAKAALSKNKLKDAALKYYEIKFMYDLLDDASKNQLFNDVIAIADEIGIKHISELVEKAIVELATGNKVEAYNLYQEINEEFYKLSEDYQEKIYPRCCELAIHLKE